MAQSQEKPSFMTQAWFLAPVGHFLAGGWFAFLGYFFDHSWIGLAFCNIWAIPKEFIYDAYFEKPHQSFWNNLWDWTCYNAGCLVMLLVVSISKLLGLGY